MQRAMVEFRLREPSLLQQARSAIDEFVAAVEEHEPGTLLYVSLQDTDDPSHFVHYMEFRDAESHQHHRTTGHVQEFVAKLYPLCEEEPRPTFLECYRELRRY